MSDRAAAPQRTRDEALAEWMSAATALAAAEVDAAGVIRWANPGFEQLAARSLAGVRLRELVRPEQWPAVEELLQAADGAWSRKALGFFPGPNGVPTDFAVSCRSVGDRYLVIGEPRGEDVGAANAQLLELNEELGQAQRQIRTQNRQLAEQNRQLAEQNDRLAEHDRLKDALLTNVSHDLRTPMTAILGYAELLRRRGGLNEKQAEAAEVIERNAGRLLRLVNDILLAAQVQAGELHLVRQPLDAADLAAEAVELARPLAADAGVRLSLEVVEGAMLCGDQIRLRQLLDNLIANAVKFTPRGGSAIVRVREDGDRLLLEVDDTGPGIPDAECDRLFAPFVRGAAVREPGTGLGLAIVRAVADAHGARLTVRSTPGRGTCVGVSVERAPGTRRASS